MHPTLRDLGRMVGGLLASRSLTKADGDALCAHALSMCIDKDLGARTWDESVIFGHRDPITWERIEVRIDGALRWDDAIGEQDPFINAEWVEPVRVSEPDTWNPSEQIETYLRLLFAPDEYVCYCLAHSEEGKPTAGVFHLTCGTLLKEIQRYSSADTIECAFGSYDPQVGGWIRFNPVDGKGTDGRIKDENVTDLRFTLVECDDPALPPDKQRAIVEKLELPVACMVHSGNKSLHAIVKIGATDIQEYRRRVKRLYEVCAQNGLRVDRANGNPSRYSRMPGLMRGENKQFIVAHHSGKHSWDEWEQWVDTVSDDLPDPECLVTVWNNLPPLAPPLIEGVLRQGHKLLLSGSSKAGKSYLLIELCAAIAEGRSWLGWKITQGRVLYLNLELDRASCLNRFAQVYGSLGWPTDHLRNITTWNLRGKAIPLDQLTPKLLRRVRSGEFAAVVIDPIYKVITGDENAADKMAHFCNQFDRLCHDLRAAVVYCHHHSKGLQGSKRAMDRSSGSGVFARDPDAVLDMIELEVPQELRLRIETDSVCHALAARLTELSPGWRDEASTDDLGSDTRLLSLAKRLLPSRESELLSLVFQVRQSAKLTTAWQIEGTMREFAWFKPKKIWFTHPTHRVDSGGDLDQIRPHDPLAKGRKPSQDSGTREAQLAKAVFDVHQELGEDAKVCDLADKLGKSQRTIREWIDGLSRKGWRISKGVIVVPKQRQVDVEPESDGATNDCSSF